MEQRQYIIAEYARLLGMRQILLQNEKGMDWVDYRRARVRLNRLKEVYKNEHGDQDSCALYSELLAYNLRWQGERSQRLRDQKKYASLIGEMANILCHRGVGQWIKNQGGELEKHYHEFCKQVFYRDNKGFSSRGNDEVIKWEWVVLSLAVEWYQQATIADCAGFKDTRWHRLAYVLDGATSLRRLYHYQGVIPYFHEKTPLEWLVTYSLK
jgi:hypothetical protein